MPVTAVVLRGTNTHTPTEEAPQRGILRHGKTLRFDLTFQNGKGRASTKQHLTQKSEPRPRPSSRGVSASTCGTDADDSALRAKDVAGGLTVGVTSVFGSALKAPIERSTHFSLHRGFHGSDAALSGVVIACTESAVGRARGIVICLVVRVLADVASAAAVGSVAPLKAGLRGVVMRGTGGRSAHALERVMVRELVVGGSGRAIGACGCVRAKGTESPEITAGVLNTLGTEIVAIAVRGVVKEDAAAVSMELPVLIDFGRAIVAQAGAQGSRSVTTGISNPARVERTQLATRAQRKEHKDHAGRTTSSKRAFLSGTTTYTVTAALSSMDAGTMALGAAKVLNAVVAHTTVQGTASAINARASPQALP